VIAALGLEGALSWVALNVSPGDQAIALDDLFLAAENGGYSRDQVLAVFENLPSGPAKDGAAKSLARTFAQNDPRAALAWALRLPPDNSAAETMAMIALEWSQSAPEDATAMALRMSPGFQLDEFLDGLTSGKIRTGGEGGARLGTRSRGGSGGIGGDPSGGRVGRERTAEGLRIGSGDDRRPLP